MKPITISVKRRIFEISAVILTAIGKLIFMDYLNQRFVFVSIAIVSWIIYDISRHKTQPGEPKKYGVAYRSPQSISSFMACFKSSATKRINEFRQTPGAAVWQPRFHDRIIRDEEEYEQKANYIKKNPENWKEGERDE